MSAGRVYRFDRFTLNLERGCLQDRQTDLELRPKSFEALRQLVENAGRLMSKDELVRAVWPDVTVSDDSLAHCIRDIRKVLDDSDERFIKTVSRRGYMFVAPVTIPVTAAQDSNAGPSHTPGTTDDIERTYREGLRARFAEDASFFVPLSGKTSELASQAARKSHRAARRRARPEYHEWLRSGEEIKQVRLASLREAVDRYPCIILLGDPGCGKTTTLENLAYEFSADERRLPVLLHLGGFNPTDSLEDFIVRGWMDLLAPGAATAADLSAFMQRRLEAGGLLFLFDALNEMPHDRYREHCLALRQFVDRWSAHGNRFVASCRVLDYGDELFGLQRVEIQPLDEEKIRQFIANEVPESWQALWQTLTDTDRSHRLLEMARNPYMLTVMIDVFAADGELIQNRAELMRRFVGILIGWAGAKSATPEAISAEVQNAALSILAFEMQRRSGFGTTARTADVKAIIPRQIEVTPGWPPQPCAPDELLGMAAGAKIIEMPVDRSTVRFYHQLLQEFFAAQHLLKLPPAQWPEFWRWPWRDDEMPAWTRPDNNFEPLPPPPPTGWEETTMLAAGLAQASRPTLIEEICRVNPVLAARCVLSGAEAPPGVRRRIVEALLAAIADPGVALRARIVAGEALGQLSDPRPGEFVVIPAGTFIMGEGREHHDVLLPQYAIGKYPVTNAEYARFVAAGGYSERSYWTQAGWHDVGKDRDAPRFWTNTRFNKPNQPVIGLSWYECVAYCRWQSAQSGRLHRLPTEAEWEKAARGEDGRTYPWGDTFDVARLNAREGREKVYGSTPVGIYSMGVSPYGLFDCAGNSWEWCATRWKKSFPYDTAQDEWAESYLEGQNLRALRGGSWNYEAEVTQCAHRFRFEPFGWNDRGGFRVVCQSLP